jgi:hypothetical protein
MDDSCGVHGVHCSMEAILPVMITVNAILISGMAPSPVS